MNLISIRINSEAIFVQTTECNTYDQIDIDCSALLDKYIETVADIIKKYQNYMLVVKTADILTKLLQYISDDMILLLPDWTLIREYPHLFDGRKVCLEYDSINRIPIDIILAMTNTKIVNIRAINHPDYLDIIPHSEIRRMELIHNSEYKYSTDLILDTVSLMDLYVSGKFLTSFFEQCSEIRHIHIPPILVYTIPDRLCENMTATISWINDKSLDDIFSKKFYKLRLNFVPFIDPPTYKKIIEHVQKSDIPIIEISGNSLLKYGRFAEQKKLHIDLLNLVETRNNKPRFTRTKVAPRLCD